MLNLGTDGFTPSAFDAFTRVPGQCRGGPVYLLKRINGIVGDLPDTEIPG